MPLLLIGLNYKTAPLDLREQLAFKEAECQIFLQAMLARSIAREAFLLSTCSRVEILIESEGDKEETAAAVINFLSIVKEIEPARFDGSLYFLSEGAAIQHSFRVAASFDSMIVGETQILGQVRAAYKTAIEIGTAGRTLHKLMQAVLRAAKRVHTETRIVANAGSLSKSAVEAAQKISGELSGRTALLIGAGVMAKLAARHLREQGIGRLLIANRTVAASTKLAADFGGSAVPFESLHEILPQADIVFSATAADRVLLDAKIVSSSQAARYFHPALFIDLSVPRNISPQIASACRNVSLLSVDDLKGTGSGADDDNDERGKEISRAEAIIVEELAAFRRGYQKKTSVVNALPQKTVFLAAS